MPLCPQVTNTPIVVVQTADFTVSTVLPGDIPATMGEVNTAVQTSANGKNKVTYSTSAPGATANTAGDIWFQYGTSSPYTGKVIAQYSGAGGTSWTSVTVSGLVIANIDAASITSGTISAIDITGGTIQTSTGANAVTLSGTDNALGIKSGGSYAGWMASIGSGAVLIHYGSTPSSTSYPRSAFSSSAATLSGTSSSGFSANSTGTNGITGTSTFYNAATFQSTVQVQGVLTAQVGSELQGSVTMGTSNTFQYLSTSGTLRSAYTYGKAVSSARAMQINSSGDFGTTASTRRKKHEIQTYAIDTNALLQLQIKQFKYLEEIDPTQVLQQGFIAEEAHDLGLDELIQFDPNGIPDYFAYEKLPIFLLQLAQEQEARIKALENGG